MLLDVLDDVFLLNFPLEATERAFDRLSVLDFHFSQPEFTPFARRNVLVSPKNTGQLC